MIEDVTVIIEPDPLDPAARFAVAQAATAGGLLVETPGRTVPRPSAGRLLDAVRIELAILCAELGRLGIPREERERALASARIVEVHDGDGVAPAG